MLNLIKRNTPDFADSFILRDIEPRNGNNVYEVFCEDNKIIICGDCKISQAMGYYAYLKKYCHVNLSHCGNRNINITSTPLFEGTLCKVIKQKRRAYLDYTTFAYSTAWWKWPEWEKEIDFMAMNGINMPLSIVGTEAVWYYTMRDFKYSETGALTFLSGPGFWSWQLLSTMSGYFSLTDVKYIESRVELGKKIIDRELELGMTPVQQGYCGMVPKTMKQLFKGMRMRLIDSWCNFPFTFLVDYNDNVFKKFGTALLEKQRQLFGSYHYYICAPFYGKKPNIKAKNYMWNIGRSIDNLLKDFDPESVWVLPSRKISEQMVKSVPKERLLIWDTDGLANTYTEQFWGYDYVLGCCNFSGDRSALNGSIDKLAENHYLTLGENCVGTGIFSEGIMQNPLYFDLAFQMLTEDDRINIDEWLADYALRRYGSTENCLLEAVKGLHKSCYSETGEGPETGSVICARPDTDFRHTAPFDCPVVKYDNNILFNVITNLLNSTKTPTDGYIYDVCDITRQYLSNLALPYYAGAINGYHRRDVSLFERSSNSFLKLCDDLDELLMTRPEFTLNEHLKAAGALALTNKDKENFELNLLAQVTVFGPIGNPINYDYAWKEWGGLIGTFYAKRWQSFFERLAIDFKKRKNFTTATRKQIAERNEYKGNPFYRSCAEFEKNWMSKVNPDPCSGKNTIETAREMLNRYSSVSE